MKITYFGHSAFLIELNEYNLLIDPFISSNPLTQCDPKSIACDYILLTHGHSDHFGDTECIARQNNATVIANWEIATYCQRLGLQAHPMNIGGKASFAFGNVKLTMAHHSSSLPDANGNAIYMGEPGGILLQVEGKTIYHAGDTCLFMDMQWIGSSHKIDLAMLPIGDNFTMGPDEALVAIDWLKPAAVIPVHYNTFPIIEVDAKAFASRVGEKGVTCHLMDADGELIF
jgi:L-ascorbate metabolism protein UlaG (beta-lactamase superfamily)